jgi:hypothetical protein
MIEENKYCKLNYLEKMKINIREYNKLIYKLYLWIIKNK